MNQRDINTLLIAEIRTLRIILGTVRSIDNKCRIRINHKEQEEIAGATV